MENSAREERTCQTQMHSLQTVRGQLSVCNLNYYGESSASLYVHMEDGIFYMEVRLDRFHKPDAVRFPMSERQRSGLQYVVWGSNILSMNGWQMESGDNTPGTRCRLEMKYTSGETFFLAFDGGRSPMGFDKAMNPIAAYFLQLAESGEDGE